MPESQNDMGRAFEFGLARAMSIKLKAGLISDSSMKVANESYIHTAQDEKNRIIKSSQAACDFLHKQDNDLTGNDFTVRIQSDQMGQAGDVRDVIITNKNTHKEIGISAKNRHFAVKHSRLSPHIDFGYEWFGLKCSTNYFSTIVPIFQDLQQRRENQQLWRDIEDKQQRYYLPILNAFKNELSNLYQQQPNNVSKGIIKYLLGRHDFYKVIKENGDVSILSFNLDGSLGWGERLPLPTNIIQIALKPDSETTLILVFDKGWQISFRIHNASSKVEPSLKFDIAPIGFPSHMSRHVIKYNK